MPAVSHIHGGLPCAGRRTKEENHGAVENNGTKWDDAGKLTIPICCSASEVTDAVFHRYTKRERLLNGYGTLESHGRHWLVANFSARFCQGSSGDDSKLFLFFSCSFHEAFDQYHESHELN